MATALEAVDGQKLSVKSEPVSMKENIESPQVERQADDDKPTSALNAKPNTGDNLAKESGQNARKEDSSKGTAKTPAQNVPAQNVPAQKVYDGKTFVEAPLPTTNPWKKAPLTVKSEATPKARAIAEKGPVETSPAIDASKAEPVSLVAAATIKGISAMPNAWATPKGTTVAQIVADPARKTEVNSNIEIASGPKQEKKARVNSPSKSPARPKPEGKMKSPEARIKSEVKTKPTPKSEVKSVKSESVTGPGSNLKLDEKADLEAKGDPDVVKSPIRGRAELDSSERIVVKVAPDENPIHGEICTKSDMPVVLSKSADQLKIEPKTEPVTDTKPESPAKSKKGDASVKST